MRVKLTQGLSGNTESWKPGDSYECDQAEAKRLIDAGVAVPIHETTPEAAVKSAPETAAARKGRITDKD